MADVARRAGVHSTTVSLALRNHPSLPELTRNRLRALAAEMGYTPDPAMRALVAYREQTRRQKSFSRLAYLTHWVNRWGWKDALGHGQFFAGAVRRGRELGYDFDHFWLGEPGMTHERMNGILHARGIKGLVVASHVEENDVPLRFDWENFCGVKIDFFPFATELHNVTNDQRVIIQLAMERARHAGYRRIGLAIPQWWDRGVRLAWSAGFLATQQILPPGDRVPLLNYPDKNDLYPISGVTDTSPSHRRLAKWLEEYQPEVVISHLPFIAGALEQLGVSIPRDLGFVDIFLEDDADTRIAGIRQNCERVGEVAVELLDMQLQQNSVGLPRFPTTTLVEGTWRDGDSLPIREAARIGAAGR